MSRACLGGGRIVGCGDARCIDLGLVLGRFASGGWLGRSRWVDVYRSRTVSGRLLRGGSGLVRFLVLER